jgi:hypothetical protein
VNAGFAVLAVDDGPRASCAPLLSVPGFGALDGQHPRLRENLAASGSTTLICGTSDSEEGRAIEAAARRAAREMRIRLVVLEDYPGNYSALAGGEADLLIVESEGAAQLHRARLGPRCPLTWICAAPRYDEYRRDAMRLRARYARRDPAARGILWAGQPETADALATLRRIGPALAPLGAELLFRAHPRDSGYREGAYEGLLAEIGIPVRDMTAHPLEACFARSPELVLTQFSSVAAEAGFQGIPSVHVLYADIGAKTLRAKKGYDAPPGCEAGASFLLRDPGGEAQMLEKAIADPRARAEVLSAFDRYYSTSRETLGALLAHLYNQ